MGHERLKHLKDNLMCSIEAQMCNLYEADAEELGCAIDMLKDIEEAMYFCTITEAMQGKGKYGGGNEYEFEFKNEHHNKKDMHEEPRMYYPNTYGRSYYSENPMMYNDGSMMYSDGSSRMYNDGRMYATNSSSNGNSNGGNNSSSSDYSEPMSMRDSREGRSPQSRRMYMEAKQMHHDKAAQLRELEKYMQELTTDMVEMIQDSSPEEKQYLEKKINTLAAKIGQMK